MPDGTDHRDAWPTSPPAEPAPQLETVDDRLRRLEQAVAALAERAPAGGAMPDGLASGYGGLVPAAVAGALAPVPPGEEGFWGRFAVWRELQLIFRMYFDPRYRLSRACQLLAPALLILMVLNYLTFSFWNVPVLAPVFERLILVGLAVALYKVLAREAARYDAVLQYLARYGR